MANEHYDFNWIILIMHDTANENVRRELFGDCYLWMDKDMFLVSRCRFEKQWVWWNGYDLTYSIYWYLAWVQDLTTNTVRAFRRNQTSSAGHRFEVRVKNFENNLSDLLSDSLTVFVRSHMNADVPWMNTSKTAKEIEIFAMVKSIALFLRESWV